MRFSNNVSDARLIAKTPIKFGISFQNSLDATVSV